MAAGEKFGIAIASVVDHRLVQRTEARAGIGADVFDAQGLEDVHHEVGSRTFVGEDFDLRWSTGFGLAGSGIRCGDSRNARLDLLRSPDPWTYGRANGQARGARSASQKAPPP